VLKAQGSKRHVIRASDEDHTACAATRVSERLDWMSPGVVGATVICAESVWCSWGEVEAIERALGFRAN
jgi:hypothetical protein